MKLYCWHNWDIDYVCAVGQSAKCKRCGAVWAGKGLPDQNTYKTIIAVSDDEFKAGEE